MISVVANVCNIYKHEINYVLFCKFLFNKSRISVSVNIDGSDLYLLFTE